jgi:hypothetical protein
MSTVATTSLSDALPSSVPKLDASGSNWAIFVFHFEDAVKAKGVWGHFDGKVIAPSVAKVRFSPVLPPFLENREPNREVWAGTEPEPELNRVEPVLPVLFCSVLGSDR